MVIFQFAMLVYQRVRFGRPSPIKDGYSKGEVINLGQEQETALTTDPVVLVEDMCRFPIVHRMSQN